MCFADSKRGTLEMVLYDPAAAAESQQRANKRARQDDGAKSSSSTASSEQTIVLDVAPIRSAPPRQLRPPPPAAPAAREEPPCLRRHFLDKLGLRADLPVHFIGHKCVTNTDLNPHQNRFRIPREAVDNRLVPILTPQEIHDANLELEVVEEVLPSPSPPAPRQKRPRQEQEQEQELQQPGPSEPQQDGAAEGTKVKKPRKKGMVHGGLPVNLVDLGAGAKQLLMSKWSSSRGTVVKGEGYLPFVRKCRFKENDNVEIWAFVQRRLRLFGADLRKESLLHILVVKKQDEEPGCCFCRDDPATSQSHARQLNPSIGIRDVMVESRQDSI